MKTKRAEHLSCAYASSTFGYLFLQSVALSLTRTVVQGLSDGQWATFEV